MRGAPEFSGFTPRDLDGFPIAAGDLEPFYNEIAAHIGISGARDDLAPYFGVEPQLLPPMRISRLASDILERYRARKALFSAAGNHHRPLPAGGPYGRP